MADGFAIRGGVEIGPATPLGESEVYGTALAEAYYIETEIAQAPRIVIGQRLERFLRDASQLQKHPDPDVAAAAERAGDCRALLREDLDLRLEQRLGLPPSDGNTMFVEMWTKPDDLFRPCPDSEIDDSHCDLDFPPRTDAKHREWFNYRRETSYTGRNAYPWTRLGYTYDWESSSGKVGPSEYVIRKGATVRVGLLGTTSTYCAG